MMKQIYAKVCIIERKKHNLDDDGEQSHKSLSSHNGSNCSHCNNEDITAI
jgi:hypothetical protein